ncbi:MAG: HlyD family efflux transporter periplasmic adaptor subunit [Planctomycetaceae bacterium]|nr:HlyD family efflux transporter periplasmic adaptor subunit [Planctomycetaceae bacterium]
MNYRGLKLALGAALVATAAYVIVGEQVAGVSADAVVNAQLLTLRAPIDGQVSLRLRELGTRLTAGELVATLTDPRPDETRLIDLQRGAEQVSVELVRLRDLEFGLESVRALYERQADEYRGGRTQQIEARLAEARANLEATLARLRETDATLRRSNELSRTGFQSIADFNKARSSQEVGMQEVQGARDRMRFLTIEINAARNGTFIGDSYNDAPHSMQRLQEVVQRLSEIAVDRMDRERRLDALRKQVEEERVRAARFREARISAPAGSTLWEIMTSNGEYVRRAQDVVRLVDCSTTMVTASVRESLYNRLKVGDGAQFKLQGDAQTYEGTITRLAGSGAETIYRNLAIGASAEHLKRFDVALLFPDLITDGRNSCAVGRTGKVVFASRPLDTWRQLTASLGLD